MTDYEIRNVSWDDLIKLTGHIYDQIQKQNLKIDTLVPILRGGMPLTLLLTRYMKDVNTTCLHIRRSKTNQTNSEFLDAEFKGITNAEALTNKNVLIVEDIIDKGLTVDMALDILKKYKPKNIYIATFFNYNKSKYINAISGESPNEIKWIKFPWEVEIW